MSVYNVHIAGSEMGLRVQFKCLRETRLDAVPCAMAAASVRRQRVER